MSDGRLIINVKHIPIDLYIVNETLLMCSVHTNVCLELCLKIETFYYLNCCIFIIRTGLFMFLLELL